MSAGRGHHKARHSRADRPLPVQSERARRDDDRAERITAVLAGVEQRIAAEDAARERSA